MSSLRQESSKTHFHEGEILAQQRMGVASEVGAFAEQAIRSYMPEQHRGFFRNLPFIVVAAKDHDDQTWVSLLCGETGFIQSPDAETLTIRAALGPEDALSEALEAGASIGLLGIMLDARRRNRINGQIIASGEGVIRVRVGQSFGNCPQYISTRQWLAQSDRTTGRPASRTKTLDSRMRQMITSADTLFVGTGHLNSTVPDANGMDASHRGGVAGFVSILNNKTLLLPDYAGNQMFNTVGNLLCDPAIGLLFIDFDSGSMLQLTGHATIDWESPALVDYPGARRLIYIDLKACVLIENALPIRWQPPSGGMRELRLQSRQVESADITSFVFSPRDGGTLPPFTAGQHLPIEVNLGTKQSVARSYSLSGAADLDTYRISVKRLTDGLVSKHLHDHLQPGDTILAAPPAGDFVLTDERRSIVLISAGAGVTPMVSLLHALTDLDRPVLFVQGARNSEHHPFQSEVSELVDRHTHLTKHIAYSQPLPQDLPDQHFDHHGRVAPDLLAGLLSATDFEADFYLCGPPMMLAELGPWLAEQGVLGSQIHIESF